MGLVPPCAWRRPLRHCLLTCGLTVCLLLRWCSRGNGRPADRGLPPIRCPPLDAWPCHSTPPLYNFFTEDKLDLEHFSQTGCGDGGRCLCRGGIRPCQAQCWRGPGYGAGTG